MRPVEHLRDVLGVQVAVLVERGDGAGRHELAAVEQGEARALVRDLIPLGNDVGADAGAIGRACAVSIGSGSDEAER